jgi:hypothetical protein
MSDADYVECWFIGGPWNNQLAGIHRHFLEPGGCFRMPVPPCFSLAGHPVPLNSAAIPLDAELETVDYYRQVSLETGVPVFSCLENARYGGYYTRFYLTSVTQT